MVGFETAGMLDDSIGLDLHDRTQHLRQRKTSQWDWSEASALITYVDQVRIDVELEMVDVLEISLKFHFSLLVCRIEI